MVCGCLRWFAVVGLSFALRASEGSLCEDAGWRMEWPQRGAKMEV